MEHISRAWRGLDLPLGLLAIVVLALVLDGVYVWQQPPSPTAGETAHTWPIALHLAHGRGYTLCAHSYFPFCGPNNDETAQREPLPVLVFAGVALLTGDSLLSAALVNVAVRSMILLALYWLARMLGGRRSGLVAAGLWAVYLPAVKLVESISGDLLAALWVVLAVGLFLRAMRLGRRSDWAGAGACVALGALTRAAVLALMLLCVAGALLVARRTWRDGGRAWWPLLRPLALVVLAAGLLIAPWVVRNAAVLGRPIVGSTLVGYNLFRENYQLHSPNYLHYVDAPEATRAVSRLLARKPELRGTENEAQIDAVYTLAALHAIEDNPRRYLLLTAYRGLMLWFDVGVDASDRTGNGVLGDLVLGEQIALLATAALGAWGRWRELWPLVLGIAVFCAMYMAIIAMVRFLVPAMPLTIALSAIGIGRACGRAPTGA